MSSIFERIFAEIVFSASCLEGGEPYPIKLWYLRRRFVNRGFANRRCEFAPEFFKFPGNSVILTHCSLGKRFILDRDPVPYRGYPEQAGEFGAPYGIFCPFFMGIP
jgi:hypothetical protein